MTDVCLRWAGSSTLVGSSSKSPSIYYFGGQQKQTSSATSGSWTNALYSLDLSSNFSTGSPPFTTLDAGNSPGSSQGSFQNRPPQVSLGALFADDANNRLIAYGGEFSDSPSVSPGPATPWAWDLKAKSWSQQQFTAASGAPTLQRSAEGAAALIPSSGSDPAVGYYFAGHLDTHTTQGWSSDTARVYLKSQVALNFGDNTFTNSSSLASSAAGNTGAANGTAEAEPSTFRADHTLSYIPGLGTDGKGLLVAVGGGNDKALLQMNVLDVFDLGAQAWIKQPAGGDIPAPRVNHCAVVASAETSTTKERTYQIFVYGGQNADQSKQFDQVAVLSIPSYTWTIVGGSASSDSGNQKGAALSGSPPARAGHTCELVGSQMVVIGGIVGTDLLCDSPGVYTYDVSSSAWSNTYTPGTTYNVPAVVAAAIGSNGTAGAGNGAGTSSGGVSSATGGGGGMSNTGAIVGGTVGGILGAFLIALIAFLIYRRRQPVRVVRDSEDMREKWVRQRASTPLEMGAAGGDGTEYYGTGTHSQANSSVPYSPLAAPFAVGHASPHGSFSHSPHMSAHGRADYRLSQLGDGGSPPNGMEEVDADDDEAAENWARSHDVGGGAHFMPKGLLRVTNPGGPNASQSSL